MSINIILVDDHKIVRCGLRTLLEQYDDLKVVAEASDGLEAVRLAQDFSPDVVVIDISLPNLNGIEATRQIIEHNQKVKVIALSMHSDKQFVIGMLQAGALGYLLKGCGFNELLSAIRAVVANRAYLSPAVSQIVIDGCVSTTSLLSSRECEVLQLLVEGRSAKDIALQLVVSTKTIEACRRTIMKKLNIKNLPELTKYAIRKGITSLDL